MANIFSEILKSANLSGSIDWFRSKLQSVLKGLRPTKVPADLRNKLVSRVVTPREIKIGQMYLFIYDPKLKDVLPYYDTFPLIFPIEIYSDSILGINLHYLPPLLRVKLLDALYDTINNDKYDETTRLNISYNILKGASRYRYFKPCIKKYLLSNIRSNMFYVSPDEWGGAVLLPTENFVKATKSKIFSDSLEKVR